jgi:acyl-CoA thioester hydrolase
MHGHMHNAAYVSHFEAALSHALRAKGLNQDFAPDGATVYLVRKIEVTYAAPCFYDQEIAIATRLARVGGSSLTFALDLVGDGVTRATAEIIWICVDKASGQPIEVPAQTRHKLEGWT